MRHKIITGSILFLSAITVLTSCTQNKMYNTLAQKGYNVSKDTIDFKPYEYVILSKGYGPTYEICNCQDTLNTIISIKGFENSNSIPLSSLGDSIQISLSDTSIKEIVDGTIKLRLTNGGMYIWHQLKIDDINYGKIQFDFISKKRNKLKNANYIVYFFCVKVKKNGKIYTIPSRHYKIM